MLFTNSMCTHEDCPECIRPSGMKNRDICWRRYKHCTQDNDASVPFKVVTLGPHTVLPIAISCLVVFSSISLTVWNLFSFKADISFGKPRSHRAPNLGYRGAELPGWFYVSLKNSSWNTINDCLHCGDEAADNRWPKARAFWIIGNSGKMFKLNTKFDADSLLYSFRHYEHDNHIPHMVTQQGLPPPPTSTVKSSLFTHAHPSPLSLAARLHLCCVNRYCYINNGWIFSGHSSYVLFPLYFSEAPVKGLCTWYALKWHYCPANTFVQYHPHHLELRLFRDRWKPTWEGTLTKVGALSVKDRKTIIESLGL